MKTDLNKNLLQNFSLKLRSKTDSGRLKEAKMLLKDVYPYELDEKNLYIEKSVVKGFYDVYISKEEVKKESNVKGLVLLSISLFVLATISILIIRHGVMENQNAMIIQKEKEELKNLEIKEQKEKEERLEKVRKEYSKKAEAGYEKIFPYIEKIYSCVSENTTIENISIEKDSFSSEVTTRDALKVLENFEKNSAFNSVKMNRTTVKNDRETVVYSGTFVRGIKEAEVNNSLEKKIEFYESELNKIKAREDKVRALRISEYIRIVRDVLRNDGCTEEYIQLRGKDSSTEIEFFILSSSTNILRFIKDIQEGSENLFDIKQIKIRNSEERNRFQTTICFDAGINIDTEKDEIALIEDGTFQISEIDKAFYKVSRAKSAESNPYAGVAFQRMQAVETNVKKIQTPVKTLSFLGLTKSGSDTFVMAKDNDMGSIYKLKLSENGPDENTCINNGLSYMAKIHGEYCEVKK